jgi:hypothetical protein
MSLTSLNKHTWKEYQYQYANDNSPPRRMWTCDHNRIHEESANVYVLFSNNGVYLDHKAASLEEAKEFFDKVS